MRMMIRVTLESPSLPQTGKDSKPVAAGMCKFLAVLHTPLKANKVTQLYMRQVCVCAHVHVVVDIYG